MTELLKIEITDERGELRELDTTEPDQFLFNYDENRARRELRELEAIERELHIKF